MTKRPPVELRVLSVKQPWADCLMLDKWVENRSWQTHYRGPLWIQAGLQALREPDEGDPAWHVPGDRLRGQIIGRVDLLECALTVDLYAIRKYLKGYQKTITVRQEELRSLVPRSNAKKWNYAGGDEYCWIVGNPRQLKVPIPCTGMLGIFKFQADPESLKLRRRPTA